MQTNDTFVGAEHWCLLSLCCSVVFIAVLFFPVGCHNQWSKEGGTRGNGVAPPPIFSLYSSPTSSILLLTLVTTLTSVIPVSFL